MAPQFPGNSHPIKIKRFSRSFHVEIDLFKSDRLPTSNYLSLPIFTVGGNDWKVTYYPEWTTPQNEGCPVSLTIRRESKEKDITVEFYITLISELRRSETIQKNITFTFNRDNPVFCIHKFISRADIQNYNISDILLISCNLGVSGEPIPRVVRNSSSSSGLCEQIEKLRDKGKSFDVTFEVGGECIPAHRLILASRSPVFQALLFGPMEEGAKEHIKIEDMKSEVFRALVYFAYSDKLILDGSRDSIDLLQDLFVAADRYAMDKLRELCENTLAKNLSVDTVMTNLLLSDQHNRAQFKMKCLDFASDHDNFMHVAQTDEYLQIMAVYPSLFSELKKELSKKVGCGYVVVKRRKTCC